MTHYNKSRQYNIFKKVVYAILNMYNNCNDILRMKLNITQIHRK